MDKSKIEDSVKGLMSVDDSSLSENATKVMPRGLPMRSFIA